MNNPDNINEAYCQAFKAGSSALAGEQDWLKSLRADAIGQFSVAGFPSRKNEAWRYTNLAPLNKQFFGLPTARGRPDMVQKDEADTGISIYIEDGQLQHVEMADTAGIHILSLREALERSPEKLKPLLARPDSGKTVEAGTSLLNSAFMADGVFVEIGKNFEPSVPVRLHYLTRADQPVAHHLRNIVMLAEGAAATIIETFSGDGPYWNNLVTDIDLAADSSLTQYVHQDEGGEAVHIGLRRVRLGTSGRFESFVLSTGGQVARDELRLDFAGEGAVADVGGVFMAGGRQSRDTYILADHNVPGTASKQDFKGVLAGRASAAFQGSVVVREGAAGTDAHQTCQNLILDRGAEANAKPELLIHADDVKCSHGATVGELDADALFYLMARGLSPDAARTVLVEAFAADVLGMVKDEAVRMQFESAVGAWMRGHLKKDASS